MQLRFSWIWIGRASCFQVKTCNCLKLFITWCMSRIWCKLFNTAISHCFSFFKAWTTKKGGKPKHHENVSPDGPIEEISSEEDEDTVFCDGTKYASAVEAKKQIMVQMQNQLGDNLKNILFTDMMPSLQKYSKINLHWFEVKKLKAVDATKQQRYLSGWFEWAFSIVFGTADDHSQPMKHFSSLDGDKFWWDSKLYAADFSPLHLFFSISTCLFGGQWLLVFSEWLLMSFTNIYVIFSRVQWIFFFLVKKWNYFFPLKFLHSSFLAYEEVSRLLSSNAGKEWWSSTRSLLPQSYHCYHYDLSRSMNSIPAHSMELPWAGVLYMMVAFTSWSQWFDTMTIIPRLHWMRAARHQQLFF